MNEVAHAVFGAVLVTIGVLAAALADRIRGLRMRRDRATAPARAAVEVIEAELGQRSDRERTPRPGLKVQQAAASDVIAALVASGHKKPVATEAVRDCSASERTTIEDWTRAALRRCAQGLS
jgi:hypothetical protein